MFKSFIRKIPAGMISMLIPYAPNLAKLKKIVLTSETNNHIKMDGAF